ncbi:MAG: T9SS type A sorting domain-containing protein [Porphyromonas sp.]|nr:T9SS type A sorting domain-containing protein [Porphyromonas sp.]
MKKKIHLLWFATLVVAFCGLVFSASAQQDYGFKIAGKSINSDNYKNLTTIPGVTIKPGGYIVYDPSSNTLKMKDANISINQTEESSLEFTTSFSIPLFILKVEGSNELNAQLEANENLHITGPGKLRIIEKEDYPALVIKKGKILRIDGGCSVIASGSSGITDLDSTGKLIIDGANVTGLGREEKNSSDGYGIGNFKSIEIKNAQIITPQGGYIGKASNYKIESDYILGVDNKPALEVQIRVKVPTVSVILKTSKGGKATISGAKDLKAVPEGTKLSVTATPDKGHQLDKILAGKEDITKTKSFTVKENTTVTVTFKKEQPKVETYKVILDTKTGGKATITGAKDLKAVPKGTKLSVTATPDKGYQLDKILAGKEDITKTKSFTVKENTTVTVSFKKMEEPKVETFNVTLETEGEGKAFITGAKDLKVVPKGTKLSVTVIPNKGYRLDKILAGKEDITETKSFTVKENTVVTVSFKKDTGVGQVLIDNTIIFPNPAKETVTIRNAVANTDIVLYATNGMQVLSSNTDNSGYAQIDVTSLAAGSYVIRIGMITKHLAIAQ